MITQRFSLISVPIVPPRSLQYTCLLTWSYCRPLLIDKIHDVPGPCCIVSRTSYSFLQKKRSRAVAVESIRVITPVISTTLFLYRLSEILKSAVNFFINSDEVTAISGLTFFKSWLYPQVEFIISI